MSRRAKYGAKTGQALVEFVVGMVALLIAAVAILAIAVLVRSDTECFVAAHEEASEASLKTGLASSFEQIKDVDPGADGMILTADDKPQHGFALNSIRQNVVAMALRSGSEEALTHPDGTKSQYNEFSDVGVGSTAVFAMEKGAESKPVELPAAVEPIFGITPEQETSQEVWLPQTGRLY